MTRTLADNESRETPRVIGLTLLTLTVATGSSFLMHKLGFTWVWEAIHRVPFWQGLAFSAALWGGAMLVCLYAPRILSAGAGYVRERGPGGLAALGRFIAAALRIAGRTPRAAISVMVSLFRIVARAAATMFAPLAPVQAAIARITEPYRIGFRLIVQPIVEPVIAPLRSALSALIARVREFSLAPLQALWARAVSPLTERVSLMAQTAHFEWKLWRMYRAEFRSAFASYREFKREFNARMSAGSSDSDRNDAPAPPPDPFAAACKAMGLPASGNFTEAAFKARYRAIMKEAHPDMGGSQERAAQISAASADIRKRKGWS